ncbi:YgaP family membrane protein [Halosolutus halophilus]|uniref:YgaP family membrane protein n=1 Tax=Halosolutus halophilus TaxID=1552990 RepID=UPI0022350C3E|nr:DUF2892 domain-containing protein [Halosolutus halophilus]
MEKNVGGYDRGIRFIVGPVLLIVGIAAVAGLLSIAAGAVGAALAVLALVVGAVLTTTAITQKCPMNSLLGVNTYKGMARSESETGDPQAGRPS